MRELVLRILRRSVLVGIALAIMGYLFAQLYFVLVRMFSGIPDKTAEWRVPLNMACFGISIMVVIELLSYVFRRKKPAVPNSIDETPTVPPKPDASP